MIDGSDRQAIIADYLDDLRLRGATITPALEQQAAAYAARLEQSRVETQQAAAERAQQVERAAAAAPAIRQAQQRRAIIEANTARAEGDGWRGSAEAARQYGIAVAERVAYHSDGTQRGRDAQAAERRVREQQQRRVAARDALIRELGGAADLAALRKAIDTERRALTERLTALDDARQWAFAARLRQAATEERG